MTIDYTKNVHRNDPVTSYMAAEDVHKFAGNHHQIIFHALLKHGSMTSEEISNKCDLDRYQVARRLPEMDAIGTVIKTGVIWRVRD